jgi:dTDP-4-amino-4,6-dideoxygalactose transaminase
MATQQLRRNVLSLYKSLLKETKGWPYYVERSERSIRGHISATIRSEFSKNKSQQNPQIIRELIENGEKELKMMKELKNDKFYRKYPLKNKEVPPMARKSRQLLSTKSQTEKKKGPGLFARFASLIFSSKGGNKPVA